MRKVFVPLSLMASAMALTGCAQADYAAGEKEPQLTEKQQVKLDKKLAGRVAGEPVSCIQRSRVRNFTAISDDVLLYEVGDTVYVNQPYGGCPGVTRDTLVTRATTNRLCSGDIARVTDLQIGIDVGSCAFSEFVPYRKVEEDSAD
ncbi:hypothetical protein [Sphingorhabdus sp. Alg239-R122]|uniref:hypothetical protein n=1 Tax=Sphingorhabdus sp. Alg239-R122 TaxID=2305989 RepID=UPI0013D9868E|nr:hypothetical protein [Sphingorhabdus sp. Alg239-R122]